MSRVSQKFMEMTSSKYVKCIKIGLWIHTDWILHFSHIFFLSVFSEPDIVKNLSIVFVTTTSVSLSWGKPEGNADSYIVRWNSTKGNSNQATTVPSSYNITNLTPGVQYDISVAAVAVNEGKKTFTKTFTSGFIVSKTF